MFLLCIPVLALGALKLPQPDGPFAVSRRTFVWTHATRLEDASIPDRSARHVAYSCFTLLPKPGHQPNIFQGSPV